MSGKEAARVYRALVRTSKRFPAYNFREYFLRRTKEDFKASRSLTDPTAAQNFLQAQKELLACLKRQVNIASFYTHDKLVVE